MVSWIDKKKSGMKNILCLTTMHDTVKTSRAQRKKPHMLVFYDKTKGGVDIVDYVSSFMSTRVRSKRWPMNAFAYSLDTARTNSRTLHDEVAGKKTSNFNFTWNLGEQLVLPEIQRRYQEKRANIGKGILEKVCRVLEIPYEAPTIPKPDLQDKGRCVCCLEALKGHPQFRNKRDALNNKVRTACEKTTCLKHAVLKCDKCVLNEQNEAEN